MITLTANGGGVRGGVVAGPPNLLPNCAAKQFNGSSVPVCGLLVLESISLALCGDEVDEGLSIV